MTQPDAPEWSRTLRRRLVAIMLCGDMRRHGRLVLSLTSALMVSCVQHGPDLDELAHRWAEAVCGQWTECGCPVDDCEAGQRQHFRERWGVDDRLPIQRCFDARIEAIGALSCDDVEEVPFTWERAACPLAPTFRGLGQSCEPAVERDRFAGACEHGLVCDAATRRCLSPVPRPNAGEPCLRTGRDDQDDWLCADGLVCDEAGLCVEDELAERTLPPPLVCDGLLVF
jgi:hypothetical protein